MTLLQRAIDGATLAATDTARGMALLEGQPPIRF
jgi:hypothetical protein